MKLAFLGDGQMGRAVQARARDAGHTIGVVFSLEHMPAGPDDLLNQLRGHDAAIDFSAADATVGHVTACARARVPLVLGTTGWQGRESEVRKIVAQCDGALIYGANFSIGVNLFYRIVTDTARRFAGLDYDAFITEAHHAKKRDAPSGTALELRRLLSTVLEREVPVASTRAGHIPGVHSVGFDGAADQILLTHTARSRDGFALGALAAAEWIAAGPRTGVFVFSDVLDEVLRRPGGAP